MYNSQHTPRAMRSHEKTTNIADVRRLASPCLEGLSEAKFNGALKGRIRADSPRRCTTNLELVLRLAHEGVHKVAVAQRADARARVGIDRIPALVELHHHQHLVLARLPDGWLG